MKTPFYKRFLISHLPSLGKYKRFAIALRDSVLPVKSTYAQGQEDIDILALLRDFPKAKTGYIDVGSNHPTDISNTFLLYRNGFRGFLVEPNAELCRLCRFFRPLDQIINIGVSESPGILPFYVSRTPVGSTFDVQHLKERQQPLHRIEYVPVLPLDDAFHSFDLQSVGVLSIDVEGWNLQVVRKALNVISKTQVLCLEYDTPQERDQILELTNAFKLIRDNGCNLILQHIQRNQ